jgi:hypothetical protein
VRRAALELAAWDSSREGKREMRRCEYARARIVAKCVARERNNPVTNEPLLREREIE